MKIIGLILLLYGVAGVAITVITYRGLRGPVENIRSLLTTLSGKLRLGGNFAEQAGASVHEGIPILNQVAQTLGEIVNFLRRVASFFGDAAGFIYGVETKMDAVVIPVPDFQKRTLPLSFGMPVPTKVQFTEHKINLGLTQITVYGPPLDLGMTFVGLNLGDVTVITGVSTNQWHPLEPVGNVFHDIGAKIDAAHNQINQTGDFVVNEVVQKRLPDTQRMVQDTGERLKDFAGKLDEASQDVQEFSQNKLLSLLPAFVLGYFGLIHFAFALTGLALLTV